MARVALLSCHGSARPTPGRQRGEIVTLPSGSLRVRVYAGVDPLSGKRRYLTETVPAGPRALAAAKKVRTRLIGQIDEQRNPTYAAWVAEADQRAAGALDEHMPALPVDLDARVKNVTPRHRRTAPR